MKRYYFIPKGSGLIDTLVIDNPPGPTKVCRIDECRTRPYANGPFASKGSYTEITEEEAIKLIISKSLKTIPKYD
jgi:hypothetical protein